jgi:hypothetical protein
MAESEGLEATLVNAESVLARALVDLVYADTNWSAAKQALHTVRLYARQLRAGIAELDRSKTSANIDNARLHCRELRSLFVELNRSASIPFRCIEPSCSLLQSPRTTCWLSYLEALVAAPHGLEPVSNDPARIPAGESDQATGGARSSAQKRLAEHERLRPSLVRESIDLLTLILAYLLYYFVDVRLQIENLPAPLAWLPQ